MRRRHRGGDVMAECARGQQAALNGDAGEHSSLQSAAREVCAVKQVPIAACRCHTWAMCPQHPLLDLAVRENSAGNCSFWDPVLF